MNFDAFSMQKSMMQQWEKMMGEYLSQQVRDPQFMAMLSQNMQQMLDLEQVFHKQLEPLLKKLNLPGKDEMERLQESLHKTESRSLNLEEEIALLKQEISSLRQEIVLLKKPKTTKAKVSKA